jgi:hypothetical protein
MIVFLSLRNKFVFHHKSVEYKTPAIVVIPVKTGIHSFGKKIDSHFRGNDIYKAFRLILS